MSYIIQARALSNLKAHFYTGRAGAGWLGDNRAEAFVYGRPEYAERQARQFAKRHRAYVWSVTYASDADAHNAGAAAMSAEMCGEW